MTTRQKVLCEHGTAGRTVRLIFSERVKRAAVFSVPHRIKIFGQSRFILALNCRYGERHIHTLKILYFKRERKIERIKTETGIIRRRSLLRTDLTRCPIETGEGGKRGFKRGGNIRRGVRTGENSFHNFFFSSGLCRVC